MHRYEKAFVCLIARATGLSEDEVRPLIRVPEPDKGDLSVPCFPLAKQFKKK